MEARQTDGTSLKFIFFISVTTFTYPLWVSILGNLAFSVYLLKYAR